MLTALYEDFFSEEADLPPAGHSRPDIIKAIERLLQQSGPWEVEDGEDPKSPLSVRANMVFGALEAAGWLEDTRPGIRRVVEMPADIAQFLELLMNFAEHGPQFVGGKVRLIYNQLQQVRHDPSGQADGFHEAAKSARSLVSSLSATRQQVGALSKALRSVKDPQEYTRTFFADFISDIYLADYRELRTDNHPLRNRFEILEIVHDLRLDEAKRESLLTWYRKSKWGSRSAEEALERDINRFLIFDRIEEHIARLHVVVDRANAQAVAFLGYQLRSRPELDLFISDALQRMARLPDELTLPSGLPASSALSDHRMTKPKARRARPARTPIREPVFTAEQRAMNRLIRRMQESRAVSPEVLAEHLNGILGDREEMTSEDLPFSSVRDMCAFLALSRTTASTQASGHGPRSYIRHLSRAGFIIEMTGQRMENNYIEAANVRIRRTIKR